MNVEDFTRWVHRRDLLDLLLLESPLHRQGTDAPPAAVEAPRGLLDGVALCVGGAGIAVVQKHLAQVQH